MTSAPARAVLLSAWLACAACEPNVLVGYAANGEDAATTSGIAGIDGSMDPASDPAQNALPEITWPSGAHPGNDLAQYLAFGTWRGRPLEVAHVFPDRGSWDGIVSPAWPVDMFAPFEGLLILSVPPYPLGMGSNEECAAGMYDAHWTTLGTFLVERDRGDSVLRLSWGPNDEGHAWAVPSGADGGEVDETARDAWRTCFQHVVDAVRSTAPDIRIDWTINPIGPPWISSYDPYETYPGDGYVDFVGIELFDMYPPARDDDDWDAVCHSLTGLCTLADFARAHGKQIGIAEWGVTSCNGDGETDTTANTGGDNPLFVRKVVDTFARNADIMAYDAYFEDDDAELCTNISDRSSHPNSAVEYRELYGLREP